jgi:hypothetical protein
MGFSGAEILMFRGLPSTLFMKLEKPLFFLAEMDGFPLLLPSEYRFGLVVPLSERGGVTSMLRSVVVEERRRRRPLGSGLVWVW